MNIHNIFSRFARAVCILTSGKYRLKQFLKVIHRVMQLVVYRFGEPAEMMYEITNLVTDILPVEKTKVFKWVSEHLPISWNPLHSESICLIV